MVPNVFLNSWKVNNESCAKSSNLPKYQFSNDWNLIWLIYDHFSSFENWLIRVFSFLTQMFLLNLWKFINQSCAKSSDLPKYLFSNDLNLIWLIYDHFYLLKIDQLEFFHYWPKCFFSIYENSLMKVVSNSLIYLNINFQMI